MHYTDQIVRDLLTEAQEAAAEGDYAQAIDQVESTLQIRDDPEVRRIVEEARLALAMARPGSGLDFDLGEAIRLLVESFDAETGGFPVVPGRAELTDSSRATPGGHPVAGDAARGQYDDGFDVDVGTGAGSVAHGTSPGVSQAVRGQAPSAHSPSDPLAATLDAIADGADSDLDSIFQDIDVATASDAASAPTPGGSPSRYSGRAESGPGHAPQSRTTAEVAVDPKLLRARTSELPAAPASREPVQPPVREPVPAAAFAGGEPASLSRGGASRRYQGPAPAPPPHRRRPDPDSGGGAQGRAASQGSGVPRGATPAAGDELSDPDDFFLGPSVRPADREPDAFVPAVVGPAESSLGFPAPDGTPDPGSTSMGIPAESDDDWFGLGAKAGKGAAPSQPFNPKSVADEYSDVLRREPDRTADPGKPPQSRSAELTPSAGPVVRDRGSAAARPPADEPARGREPTMPERHAPRPAPANDSAFAAVRAGFSGGAPSSPTPFTPEASARKLAGGARRPDVAPQHPGDDSRGAGASRSSPTSSRSQAAPSRNEAASSVPSSGGRYGASRAPEAAASPEARVAEARHLIADGDPNEAIRLMDALLAVRAGFRPALEAIGEAKRAIEALQLMKLGPIDHVPQLRIPEGRLQSMPLDPRAMFLLTRLDGMSTFEDLIDSAGLPRADVIAILAHLVTAGVISRR